MTPQKITRLSTLPADIERTRERIDRDVVKWPNQNIENFERLISLEEEAFSLVEEWYNEGLADAKRRKDQANLKRLEEELAEGKKRFRERLERLEKALEREQSGEMSLAAVHK